MKYISYKTIKNPIQPHEWEGKTIEKVIRVPFKWNDPLVIVWFTDNTIGYIRGQNYNAQRKEWESNYLWDRPILGTKEYPEEIEEMIKYLFENRLFSPEEYDEFIKGRQAEEETDTKRHLAYEKQQDMKRLKEIKEKYNL